MSDPVVRMVRTMFKWDQPSRVDEALADEAAESKRLRQWNAEIDGRDRKRCRSCGRQAKPDAIGLTQRAHRHHIVYASAGGSDAPFNRVTLCATCHNDEHQHRLRIEGTDAWEGLEFWRKDDEGVWYLARREIAPHVVEKD